MNIDIETDLQLRLETIKSLAEHLLVIDEEEYEKMMNPNREKIGFTIPQRIALENCLDDVFNNCDNFANITNYRKEVYEFRMGQIEGIISDEEFDNKMFELETKYPFSIQDELNNDISDNRYKLVEECLDETEDLLIQMIKDNNFIFDNIINVIYTHIKKIFD